MPFKKDEINLYSNDRLVALSDGSFKYFDTTGDYEDIANIEDLQDWLGADGYDDYDKRIENWLASLQ